MSRSPVLRASVLAMALSAAAAVPGLAQQRPPERRMDRMELERRVRARFGQMVKERLGLTDEQAARLAETVESFRQDRQSLFREEQALQKRVEAALLEGGPSDDEARTLLDQMQKLQFDEAKLFQSEQEALLQVLTPSQLVRFHALREQMGRRIQQLRGGPGMSGRRGPGGGPGGPPGSAPDLFDPYFPGL
ncbi:MAG: Spy/CpxP family protein refolding chaperone [Gemmatimonadota bacterium]|jgi:Spy/CpxP family protein refolding chaperone